MIYNTTSVNGTTGLIGLSYALSLYVAYLTYLRLTKNHECCSHLVTLASWASVHSAPRSHDLFGHIRRLHKPRLTWHFISPCCNAKRSYPEPTWHHTRCRPRDNWITQLEQDRHPCRSTVCGP